MSIRLMGDHPLARNEQGRLKSRIGTVFPHHQVLITQPGIHASQRILFLDDLNRQRQAQGQPALTPGEEIRECLASVDLIMQEDCLLIRPDPAHMELAFEADELLQELVSKIQIKFLQVSEENVRRALRRRGEYWRISSVPQTADEMRHLILASRINIGGLPIYYYNQLCGIRYLTCQALASLGQLPPKDLAFHLEEIQTHSTKINRYGFPEVDFFLTRDSFGADNFTARNFQPSTPNQLAADFKELSTAFTQAVPVELRRDDPDDPAWRKLMLSHLLGKKNETVSEEVLHGLGPEFFLQIEWLPGGRFEEGELIFDPIYDESASAQAAPPRAAVLDEKVKGLIFNFIREHGDLECINIGRVASSLSQRAKASGRRDVYIAELKPLLKPTIVRIIRLQKWGIREHLDTNEDLLAAIMQSEEYTEYTLDRRLGCRQLGMNLPNQISLGRVSETYAGAQPQYHGCRIWAAYFERDYIPGVATDKINASKFAQRDYALRFALLLGQAAAPNLVVGRASLDHQTLFDDGDEVLIEDENGGPQKIVVNDLTGAFVEYLKPFEEFLAGYAQPVLRRRHCLVDAAEFANAYVAAFVSHLRRIQHDYRKRRRAFDTLFKHLPRDVKGSLAYRWERVLARLDQTQPEALGALLRSHLSL